ncbi:MAG: hypothetical protein IJW35_04345, partial [Lentisphaeria bacterium]|nr:hypothetical protein [Lentisphaeria bacterium]
MSENNVIVASKYLSGKVPEVALVARGDAESDFSGYTVEGNGVLFVFNNDLYITDAENIARIVSASGADATLLDGTVIPGAVAGSNVGTLGSGTSLVIGVEYSGLTEKLHVSTRNIVACNAVCFDNSAVDGGAFRTDTSGQSIEISGMTFTGNTTAGSGGAFLIAAKDSFRASNLLLVNNSAWYTGGAIHNAGTGFVSGSTFSGNYSRTGGGGINNNPEGVLTVENSKFIGNSGTAALNNLGTLTVGNVYFENNAAGAINNTGTVTVNGLITLVTAADKISGQGTWTVDCDAFLSAEKVFNKVFDTQAAITLPAVTLKNETLNYSVTTTVIDGDLFVMKEGLTLTIAPILSVNGDVYQASYNGKDYYSTGYSSLDSALKAGKTLVMSGYTVSDLTALMSLADGRVIIGVDGAGFFNNSAAANGGAIRNNTGINAELYGLTFSGNHVTGSGGVIYNSGNLTGADLLFDGNYTSAPDNKGYHGGAIHTNGGKVALTDSVFSNNSADQRGGAINMTSGQVDLSGVTFANNSNRTQQGSAIYVTGSVLNIGKSAENVSKFLNNTGSAAIYNADGTVTMGNVYFSGNAGAVSGAVTVNGLVTLATATDKITGTVTIDGASFISGDQLQAVLAIDSEATVSNVAATDGYLTFKDGLDVYVTNADVVASIVTTTGKAMTLTTGGVDYAGAGCQTLAEAAALGSSVVLDKDVVVSERLTPTNALNIIGVDGASFQNCSVDGSNYGGAIYSNKIVNISNVAFSNNTASRGGAVCFYGAGGGVFDNVTFDSNTGRDDLAAALFINDATGDVTVKNSTFTNNTGGVIYNNSGSLTVEKSYFSGNKSSYPSNATAIHINGDGAETVISGSTFAGNPGKGEVIRAKAGTVTIQAAENGQKTVFADNSTNAVHVEAGVSVNISGTTFSGNGGSAIVNYGMVTVSDSSFMTGSDDIYNCGEITFAGDIVLNGSLGTNADNPGTYKVAGANFILGQGAALNNLDFSTATITVDGALYVDKAVTVATKVGKIGDYTITGNPFLMLEVIDSNLVLKEIAGETITETSYTGKGLTVMDGGAVGTFFATKDNESEIATKISGGKVESNLVGGAYVSAGKTAAVDKVALLIGGTAEVAAKVYAGGYLYGNAGDAEAAAEAQLTVDEVNITLDGGAVSTNMYGGAHARQNGNAKVDTVNITVTDGSHGRIYAGGWAEKGAVSSVGTANVIISGGTVDYLYGGGANADGKTYVTTTNITVSDAAVVNTIFMGGRYGYSYVNTVELTFDGEAKTLNRLSGVSSAGMDYAKATVVELETNVTADLID